MVFAANNARSSWKTRTHISSYIFVQLIYSILQDMVSKKNHYLAAKAVKEVFINFSWLATRFQDNAPFWQYWEYIGMLRLIPSGWFPKFSAEWMSKHYPDVGAPGTHLVWMPWMPCWKCCFLQGWQRGQWWRDFQWSTSPYVFLCWQSLNIRAIWFCFSSVL